jgi:hypothetical protein
MNDAPAAGVAQDLRAPLTFAPFRGRVVYRNVLRRYDGKRLWKPSMRPYRWSAGVSTLYTSLDLDVALAERIKHTLAAPIEVVVGTAQVSIKQAVDLTTDDALRSLAGVLTRDVTAADHAVPQRIGTALSRRGAAALLVPAAVGEVAALFPQFRFVRGGRTESRTTPASGVNVVIFSDNLDRSDVIRIRGRRPFRCVIQGLVGLDRRMG